MKLFKMLGVFVFAVFLPAAMSCAYAGQPQVPQPKHWDLPIPADATPEQKKNIEEKNKYGVYPGTPRCEGDILINLGGIKMMVPRGGEFDLPGKKHLKNDLRGPEYNCALSAIDVSRYDTPELVLMAGSGKHPNASEKVLEADIAKNRNLGKSKFLPDGTEYIDGSWDYYILPPGKAPTRDNRPILVYCSGKYEKEKDKIWFRSEGCYSTYIHPLGFSVYYKYPRTKYAPL